MAGAATARARLYGDCIGNHGCHHHGLRSDGCDAHACAGCEAASKWCFVLVLADGERKSAATQGLQEADGGSDRVGPP